MKKLSILATLIILGNNLYSQDSTGSPSTWALYLHNENSLGTYGFYMGIGVTGQWDVTTISISYKPISELSIVTLPSRYVNCSSIMAGRIFRVNSGAIHLSAGVSFLRGNTRGEFLYEEVEPLTRFTTRHYQEFTYNIRGFPVEVQYFITPTSFFGVGVAASANFNSVKQFYGIGVHFQLGKVWKIAEN